MMISRGGLFGWTIAAVVMSRGGVGCRPAFGQASNGNDDAGCGKTVVAPADGVPPYQADGSFAIGGTAIRGATTQQPA